MILVLFSNYKNGIKYLISDDVEWLKFHNLIVGSRNTDVNLEDEFVNFMFDEYDNDRYIWSKFNNTNCIDFSLITDIVVVTWLD